MVMWYARYSISLSSASSSAFAFKTHEQIDGCILFVHQQPSLGTIVFLGQFFFFLGYDHHTEASMFILLVQAPLCSSSPM